MELPDTGRDPPELGCRSKRRIENKKTNEYVIKKGLNKSLAIQGDQKKLLLDEISKRVVAVSKGSHRLSLAINLLVRDTICPQKDIRNAVLPDFLSSKNATFAYQLMTGQDESRKPDITVKTFLDKRETFLPKPPVRFPGDTNSLVRASDMYITNYRTYLVTNFKAIQCRFVSIWCARHQIPDNEKHFIRYLINGWKLPNNVPNWAMVLDKKTFNMIKFHRQLLNLNTVPLCEKWLKSNYERIVIYFYFLSNFFKKNSSKELLLAPISNIRATFLHIDTTVLYGILKSIGIITCNFKTFDSLRNEQWLSIFDVQKPLTSRQKNYANFTHTVQTDGISICIHYRRPKLNTLNPEEPIVIDKKEDANTRIIGNDPGRVILFYGAEKVNETKYKYYKLSRKNYYQDSGITDANKKKDKWNMEIQEPLTELSKNSPKGTSVKGFLSYLEKVNIHYTILWNEYLKKRWGRSRFNLYSGKKSVYDLFFQSLDDGSGKKLVIAYGDAGFASTNKHELSAPTTTLQKQCKKWYKTELVDEFRTTQIHSRTNTKLASVLENGKKVRGLLWCDSTNNSKFVNRDKNAAENMERCYRLVERPVQLSRTSPKLEEPAPVRIKAFEAVIVPRRGESNEVFNPFGFEWAASSSKKVNLLFHNLFV